MRLIDVDKLNLNLCNTVGDAIKEIENAETIDAVSLKWLALWTKKYIEKTRSEVGVLSEKEVTVAEAFNEMKYDWREENG